MKINYQKTSDSFPSINNLGRNLDYMITLIFIIRVISVSIYPQPLNSSKVTLISNTRIFPLGTFKSCHASTIVELGKKNYMSAWFAGSYEGANDVGIWISKYLENNWSLPENVAIGKDTAGNQLACWNPVLFKTMKNTLLLFYKVGINPREWWGMVIRSYDNGNTWSEPQTLPKGFLGPIKDKPVQLTSGNILCPSSIESKEGKWTIHLEITNESLSSWRKIEIEADDTIGVIQPCILEHPDGRLQMLCRSRQNFIYETWSADMGLHWSKLSKTSLPNPNSGIDAAKLDDGSFILIYNPLVHGKEWFLGRNVLNAAISVDGENWKDIYQLENEMVGEFSYPAVVQASDKSILITYTENRKSIKYVNLILNEN
jgi:predicted neuraminidase